MRDPGQFSYHLNKLTEYYVRRTPDGYDLRMAGVNVVWAIASGRFTADSHRDPFPVDSDCEWCSGPLEARYDDGLLFVDCVDCGWMHQMFPFPPSGVVGRTDEELVTVSDQFARSYFTLVARDICPNCAASGRLTHLEHERDAPPDLRREHIGEEARTHPLGDELEMVTTVKFECRCCGMWTTSNLATLFLYHPTVVQFHRDHGVDITEIPVWEMERYGRRCETDVVLTDPLEFTVRFTVDGESLSITVGASLGDLTTRRTHRSD
jgi:hypothetical protein